MRIGFRSPTHCLRPGGKGDRVGFAAVTEEDDGLMLANRLFLGQGEIGGADRGAASCIEISGSKTLLILI